MREWLLMLTFHGSFRYTVGGKDQTFSVGDAVLVEPEIPQDYGPIGPRPWGVRWAVFTPPTAWWEYLRWPEVARGLRQVTINKRPDFARVLRLFDDAQQIAAGVSPWRAALAMNALEGALIRCMEQVKKPTADLDQRLQNAIDHLCQHCDRDLSVEHVASSVGLSAPHFNRLFRQHIGQTPHTFLETQRLEKAAQLLRASPLPINAIARQCGYQHALYFATRFKRRYAMTPSAYRSNPGR